MKCAICNSTEFSFNDGVYFCQECNSQIKESRKEESEQEGFSRRSLLRSPAAKKSEKPEGNKKKQYISHWTTTEAYNVILYKQVCALINLGASEKLKDIVLYIWSKYLQKCELAFRNDYNASEELPRLSAFPRRRDISVLYGEENVKKNKASKKKPVLRKSHSTKIKSVQVIDTSSEDVRTSESENEVTEDTQSEIESEIQDSEDDSQQKKKEINFSSHARKLQRTFGKKKFRNSSFHVADNCLDNMTMSKTLCFCYLGLLYTEDQLLLSDIIRFVNEEKIPYIYVTNCFPSTMKMQGSDYMSFKKFSSPDPCKISRLSGKLFDFLSLPKFKHRSLMPIVCRFVKDLNLPDEMIQIVKLLKERNEKLGNDGYEITQNEGRIPHYELQAMALIVLALKMLFVLDGEYEIEHSEIMAKVNILLGGTKLFVWNEWKKQSMLKEYVFMKSGSSYYNFSLLDSLNADLIIEKYPYEIIDETQDHSQRSSSKNRDVFFSARKEIKKILAEITSVEVPSSPTLTSFPLKSQVSDFMAHWKTMPIYKDTKHIDFTFLSQDFSSQQLVYRQSGEMHTDSKELIHLLVSSLYVNSELLTLGWGASNYTNIVRTSAKYWFKNMDINSLADAKPAWLENLPPPFAWLIKYLCKYIHVSCRDLYLAVTPFEKALFLQKKHVKAEQL